MAATSNRRSRETHPRGPDRSRHQTRARDVHHQLGGGAVSENWALDVAIYGGRLAGEHALVIRADAQTRLSESLTREQEFAVQRTAFLEGVAAPEPLWLCGAASEIGRPFFLMRRAGGVADPRRLAREDDLFVSRDAFTERLGEELARLHG